MKTILCIKVSELYDDTKIFPTLEAYIQYSKDKDYVPAFIHEGVYRVFYDSSEERVSLQEFVDLGFIEENSFDENLLLAEAECAVKQASQARENFLSSLNGACVTGNFGFGPKTVERYIAEFKKTNKYKWKD